MDAVRRTAAPVRAVTTAAAVAVLAVTATASTAHAAAVAPANGSYSWSSAWTDGTGGAKEIVTFGVAGGKTAKLQDVRGICAGHYGVMHSFQGKEGQVRVKRGAFTKATDVTLDGDTATVTVHVAWTAPKKARGWIKVTGDWAGQQCSGAKQAFKLFYSK